MNLAHWQHGCLYPKHIFVRVEGEAIEVALIDLEKSRRRLTVNKASQHDLKQLKRRSSWTGAQWQAFIYGYQTAFGSAIKGCRHEIRNHSRFVAGRRSRRGYSRGCRLARTRAERGADERRS